VKLSLYASGIERDKQQDCNGVDDQIFGCAEQSEMGTAERESGTPARSETGAFWRAPFWFTSKRAKRNRNEGPFGSTSLCLLDDAMLPK
jgi:hypothetical protein